MASAAIKDSSMSKTDSSANKMSADSTKK
jgi:hypothetical protein